MAGFKLRKDPGTGDVEEWTISAGTAYVPGDLFDLAAGASTCTVTTSGSLCYDRKGVLMAAVSATDTLLKVRIVDTQQVWEVESANNSNASHNGDGMVLRKLAQPYDSC